jgi:succinate dehydrogenase / fumarate reductase iron-sulfur subunit
MRINGCARLACNTQLSLAVAEAVRAAGHDWDGEPHEAPVCIAPLGNMPVVKDLITDMAGFWAKLRSVQPWLQPLADADPDRERLMTPETYGVMAQALLCVECGCCYSECCTLEASAEFVGPAALAKAFRYAADTRDEQTHRRMFDLSVEHGLWECTRCYYCTQRCPKHLRVRELIAKLDRLAYDEGLRTDPGVRRASAVVASVRESGRLDEVRLPLKAEGLAKALAKAPAALRAAAAGKLTPQAPEPVERLEDVRKVIEAVEESR